MYSLPTLSNFFFCHDVFERLLLQIQQKASVSGKRVEWNIENILENGAIADNEQFLLFAQCFQTNFALIINILKHFTTDIVLLFPRFDTC